MRRETIRPVGGDVHRGVAHRVVISVQNAELQRRRKSGTGDRARWPLNHAQVVGRDWRNGERPGHSVLIAQRPGRNRICTRLGELQVAEGGHTIHGKYGCHAVAGECAGAVGRQCHLGGAIRSGAVFVGDVKNNRRHHATGWRALGIMCQFHQKLVPLGPDRAAARCRQTDLHTAHHRQRLHAREVDLHMAAGVGRRKEGLGQGNILPACGRENVVALHHPCAVDGYIE